MYTDMELEQLRKEAVNQFWIRIGIVIIVALCCVKLSPFLMLFVALTGIVVVALLPNSRKKKYIEGVKDSAVRSLFEKAFESVSVDYSRGFSKNFISDTGLLTMGNEYSSDDYVSGEYNGVSFSRSDVYVADTTSDGEGNSSTTVYFEGRWMVFKFPKTLSGDLQVFEKSFHYAKKRKGLFTRKTERRHEIFLEDEDFNKRYVVMAQDDHDAFYFLTPHMMEKIDRYCSNSDGRFMLGIIGPYLHVAINNSKNPMEPSIFRKNDVEEVRAEVSNEIELIRRTVEEFNLDIYQ